MVDAAFGFFLSAHAHVDLADLRLFVADDENERNLLQGVLANLRVHLFIASVDMHAAPTALRASATLLA